MEGTDKYPEAVQNILDRDILKRDKNDPVRIAYNLALDLHDGQKRKGLEEQDYITHPLRVYNLVKRCIDRNIPDRNVTLAATLLHDAIEDYKKEDIKSGGINAEVARHEATAKIRSAFTDKKIADKVLQIVEEVTNPISFTNKKGETISKKEWQVKHVRDISNQGKLIKICDQTANVISNIEEVPNWNYDRIISYADKATAVVTAARENIKERDRYVPAVGYAARIYDKVAAQCQEIFDDMRKNGDPIPPSSPRVSIPIKTIVNEVLAGGRNWRINR